MVREAPPVAGLYPAGNSHWGGVVRPTLRIAGEGVPMAAPPPVRPPVAPVVEAPLGSTHGWVAPVQGLYICPCLVVE